MLSSIGTSFADRYDNSLLRRALSLDAFSLLVAYLILVAVKFAWVAGAEGPLMFGDEYLYKTLAQSLFLGHGYTIGGYYFYGYPPLYSIVLAPAFLFQDWYGWLLRINVLASSAVVFPIWWIARQFLPRRESWMAVLLGSITPFHWVTPRILMSENLFVPLVLVAMATVVADTHRPSVKQCLATGAVWALALMTRYIFLPIIPVLLLLWWFQPWIVRQVRLVELFRGRWHRLLWLFAGSALIYALWALMVVTQSADFSKALGLSTATDNLRFETVPSGNRFFELLFWVGVCSAYVLLASAPYLHLAISYLFARIKSAERRELFFATAFLGLLGTFTAVTIYLSWRWFIDRRYLEGRYLMALFPLLPTLALVFAQRLAAIPVPRRLVMVWVGLIAAMGLIYAAYRLLISNSPIGVNPDFANTIWVVPDVAAFQIETIPLFGTLIRLLFPLLILQIALYAFLRRHLTVWVTLAALVFNLVCCGDLAEQIEYQQAEATHGRVLAQVMQPYAQLGNSVQVVPIIVERGANVSSSYMQSALEFWGIPRTIFDLNLSSADQPVEPAFPTGGVLLTTTAHPNPRVTYRVHDSEFNIYTFDLLTDSSAALLIQEFGPTEAIAGQPFNEQPDGSSAFWFKTRNARAGLLLVFNGKEYAIVFGSPELVTAAIPMEELRSAGVFDLYLFDPAKKQKSNTVKFSIK